MSLLKYLNECSSFDTGSDSTHQENHHWSNRDEKMLHAVVSRLGQTFRSLETMGDIKDRATASSERAVMTLLMRCGYMEMGTDYFHDSVASSMSGGDSKMQEGVESKKMESDSKMDEEGDL